MSSPNFTHTRAGVSAPEKGTFPLDHFRECKSFIDKYLECVNKHESMPKRCQKLQIEYLNCRMDHNLMKRESLEDLGYTKQNSYETEMDQKKALYSKYGMLSNQVKSEVQNYFDSELNKNTSNDEK